MALQRDLYHRISEETEKCFRRMIVSTEGKIPKEVCMVNAISTVVLGNMDHASVFQELNQPMLESAIEDNHVFQMIKLIVKAYCKIRFYHLGDVESSKLAGPKIRKKLSKLILFKSQQDNIRQHLWIYLIFEPTLKLFCDIDFRIIEIFIIIIIRVDCGVILPINLKNWQFYFHFVTFLSVNLLERYIAKERENLVFVYSFI